VLKILFSNFYFKKQSIMFNFDNSYLSLPSNFYSLVKPSTLEHAEIELQNNSLLHELGISTSDASEPNFLLNQFGDFSSSYAQAYAGHQFGHFTKLGDGRAVMIGEHITQDNNRFDIQAKGSGRTAYSRGGDGNATLKAMLREYLISEAMHNLKISSSRSLAVFKTNEDVYRDTVHQGAALIRVMKSHSRVGTFEYAAHLGSTDDLKALTNYTIKRLYPELSNDDNIALALLKKVMIQQINLVVDWMRVGFIHGVMNTDNTAISGETFDYGPCAFMNVYEPNTVYSSIDQNSRYAYGNQPKIIKWNLSRFAEALLPLIHHDQNKSLALAQECINEFDAIWNHKYYNMMLNKIGIVSSTDEHWELIDELLQLMHGLKLDYTNTFAALSGEVPFENNALNNVDFIHWNEKRNNIILLLNSFENAKQLMKENNPVFIPRNHLVEEALDNAINGDMSAYLKLQDVLSKPYSYNPYNELFTKPSAQTFEENYQTFCGT
jgi:serine/tyrosine/threonine adenylyltransferase